VVLYKITFNLSNKRSDVEMKGVIDFNTRLRLFYTSPLWIGNKEYFQL
jgi:hypothetical protein